MSFETAQPELGSQLWALIQCGFPKAWEMLNDRGDDDPGPIAVIDVGNGALDHPALKGRVEICRQAPNASTALHAAGVIGTIAAADDLPQMIGACSAKIHYYNAWRRDGFDRPTFLRALKDIASSGAVVLNLSIGSPERDEEIDDAIEECISAGVVVVAAMGDFEGETNATLYPAGFDGVIAVGATNRHDRRLPVSAIGRHISISAPGEQVWTIMSSDAYGYRGGTSFSAPLVSAAAWLARRAGIPSESVKKRLEETADRSGFPLGTASGELPKSVEVGAGRLDIAQLASEIRTRTPAEVAAVSSSWEEWRPRWHAQPKEQSRSRG